MKARRIYISGPITGMVDLNRQAFGAAAQALREAGFEPVNPHENGVERSAPWSDHMRADIKMLMDCEGVALLPGWEHSKGARIEQGIAANLGMPTDTLAAWLAMERRA